MDQKKTGSFLRKLRKEKGYTQEELADYYGVDIRELIDGERKSEKVDKDVKETALKVADYNKEERRRLMERLHIFSWLGVASFTVFIVLEILGLTESGVTESIASVGVDTVNMKGEGFTCFVKEGDKVKAGQKLIAFDINKIVQAGYSPTTAVLLTNSDDYSNFMVKKMGRTERMEEMLTV